MTIILFILILGVLVLVHELGHFIFAKKAGVRVDEFGFGYPPRAITLGERWGTKFSINWIPFGGFVKIFGENYEEAESLKLKAESKKEDFSEAPSSKLQAKSFLQVSKLSQALILFAGVLFNFLFAWILFSIGFVAGLPAPVDNDFGYQAKDPALTIVSIMPDSPAQNAGLKSGDKIIMVKNSAESPVELTPELVSQFVFESDGKVLVGVERGGEVVNVEVLPDSSLVAGKKIIGINMDMVGTLSLPIHKSVIEGAKITGELTYLTITGILGLIGGAFTGSADLSQVTGPIGIVGLVGDASRLGFTYLLTFTALISINLAVVNLIPFPALDGGRLLFVAIEAISRKKIPAKFGTYANGIGFAILIFLMLLVTAKDVKNLF